MILDKERELLKEYSIEPSDYSDLVKLIKGFNG